MRRKPNLARYRSCASKCKYKLKQQQGTCQCKLIDMERILESQMLEGEIGLVIDYEPGKALAVDVLQAAMGMIEALDKLDAALLSSVNTSLQPVSVLNDVQHSSLKMLLARALLAYS